jgi:hypothetical protein
VACGDVEGVTYGRGSGTRSTRRGAGAAPTPDYGGQQVAATLQSVRGSGDEDTTSVLLGPRFLRVRMDHLVASAGAGTGMLGSFRLPEGV